MDDGWGQMVMPGVFMIPGKTVAVESSANINGDDNPFTQAESIHRDIQELKIIVAKLKESNREIVEYLADSTRGRDDTWRRVAGLSGEVCDEDEEFREAVRENEHVIREKEKEIKCLEKIIEAQRCGTELHTQNNSPAIVASTEEPEYHEDNGPRLYIDL